MLRVVICALVGISLFAGEGEAKPKLSVIYQDYVKPSHVMAYESSTKMMIETLGKMENRSEFMKFHTYASDRFVYTYVTPIENFASMDSMHEAWDSAFMSMPEDMQGKMMEAMETVDHYNMFVVAFRPELSFVNPNGKVSPDTAPFVHYSFYMIQPGKEQVFEEVCKGFAAMMAKDSGETFTVHQKVSGENMPAYAVIHYGNSQSQIMAYFESFMAKMSAEAQKLMGQSTSVTRAHESMFGMARPDLSLQ
ncbi:MAG: hypothetical protein KDC35_01045 [Acidobacteria bacterium]|nr:hypothetical protein [Acidobacteriota bacterium]